ncbi:MAG: hypothetical protein RL662_745 [Bacteroidota bacterium]|jgi:hypothetical protein
MKKYKIKVVSFILAGSLLLASCSSSTVIRSNPEGARVFIDGQSVGVTPYKHSDTKIVGSVTDVQILKDGYEPFNTTISRNEKADVGAIVGGLFLLFPFLWTMGYNPSHSYELVPAGKTLNVSNGEYVRTKVDKSEELKKLKGLLDDKILTIEEYEKEKKKILDN